MVRIVDPYRSAPLFTIYDVFREWKKRKMWQNAIVIFQQHCSAYSCSTSVNPIDCFWPPKVYSSICLLHMSFIVDICYLVLCTYLSKITVYHKRYHLLFMKEMHAMNLKIWFLKLQDNVSVIQLCVYYQL